MQALTAVTVVRLTDLPLHVHVVGLLDRLVLVSLPSKTADKEHSTQTGVKSAFGEENGLLCSQRSALSLPHSSLLQLIQPIMRVCIGLPS